MFKIVNCSLSKPLSVVGVAEAGTQETGGNRGKALDGQGGIETPPSSGKESYL